MEKLQHSGSNVLSKSQLNQGLVFQGIKTIRPPPAEWKCVVASLASYTMELHQKSASCFAHPARLQRLGPAPSPADGRGLALFAKIF